MSCCYKKNGKREEGIGNGSITVPAMSLVAAKISFPIPYSRFPIPVSDSGVVS